MNREADYIEVPLTHEAHQWAEQFAAKQASVAKGKQVYLNTLAVCMVQDYLKWLSIPTDFTQGDCWHPGLRAKFDIADLVVPQVGKVECRSLLPDQTRFTLPPEVRRDRLGYVAVQFGETVNFARLLGFIPTIKALTFVEVSMLDLYPLVIYAISGQKLIFRGSQMVLEMKPLEDMNRLA
ncbi:MULTISPECIES: DUF1822 family protein [Leptolyngbya]|uniref:DUF1822 family protein n=1 Tax=Leptolyngbya TaxID=47251 RepID=UPI001685610C|nr:DUF1822 family protein [Leptolyngbya sp. FACHB-1624]MBD1854819.1 DUF1822 family protein [Leptolyngbya sp. FACHB-1624]